MLIALIFVLCVVTINGESIDQNGERKSRQLDLGLQDIRNDNGELTTTIQEPAAPTARNLVEGYLPPISSSSSPKLVTAQNQQVLDFRSVNSIEKESESCKFSLDQEACKTKEISASSSKISEPSRELVPPFNDLEKDINIKITTTLIPKLEETKVNEEENEITTTTLGTTTTERIVTKLLKVSPIQNTASATTTTTQINLSGNKAEASNELRSYIPPQTDYSAAAQTNFAVTRPASQNNHHHDHHHHHDENFNICTDAFHSFLCAPLKARKRITGALPSNLIGSSSFINYQKSLAILDREIASSNDFKNEYLPPRPSPNNFIQSAYSSSFPTKKSNVIVTTTTRPKSTSKVIFRPINPNGRVPNTLYAKPPPSNRVTDSTLPTPATSIKNYSGNVSISLPSKIPAAYSTSGSLPPKVDVFSSISSNENTFYLPPNLNPQPSPSFISTSQNFSPITSTITPLPSTFVSFPAVTTFSPSFSNSIFSSQKPKRVYSTTLKPFSTAPTQASTTVLNVQTSSLASQFSNNIYSPPSSENASFSRFSSTTVKPNLSSEKFSEKYSNTKNSYLPPDLKEPAAAQISSTVVPAAERKNPVHHGRDLCTDPFHSFLCTNSKPRKRITGQLPLGFKPESSNTDEVRLKSEPSSQDENKIRPYKSLKETSAQNLGYAYAKPINSLLPEAVTSTLPPSTKYFYPKPEKVFPLPSQQEVKAGPLISSTTKKPELTLRPSEASVRPDKIFPSTAGQENTKITTTISSPTTGYSYPKPQKPFFLPTEQTELREKPKEKTLSSVAPSLSLPTNQVRGYQYAKPDQSLNLPEKKGYSYPKPENRLELPTENRSKTLASQNNFDIDPFENSGSVDFIPVNKIEYKRGEPSKLLMGLRKFGERMKKRERQAQLIKKQYTNT